MQLADAAKVIGVVITSSPSLMPAANEAPCNAAVPLDIATAYFTPTYLPNFSSNSSILGPVVR